MKNAIIKMLFFSLITVGGLTVANAQVSSDTVFRAKIPFKFTVRDKTFPAGEYLIKPTDDPTDLPTLFEITSLDQGRSMTVIFETNPASVATAPTESSLIFDKTDGKYYLAEMWAAGEADGSTVELTKAEREAVNAMNSKHERKVVKSGRMKVVERSE